MITRLQVSGYKSLDGVDVSFRPLTVVFGPNAVGKSNLLDLLGLVSRMVTEPTLDQAFERHRGAPLEAFTFDERGLPGLQERDSARFSIAVDVELSPSVVDRVERQIAQAREGLVSESSGVKRRTVTERRLRYAVTVEVRTATGHLRVVDEGLVALKDDRTPKASRSRMPFIELHPSGEHVVLRMEKQGRPTHEEVGQDRTIVSKPLYPPHYPHVIALREELSRWRFYFLEPSAMREDTPVKEVETLASNGADIAAFYNTLRARNELQFRALGKSLKQVVPSIDRLDVQRTDQGMVRVLVEESGMPLSSRLISEGTLRVLGLLAITNPLEPLSLVGYEEPENGVHPNRLAMVARLLENAATRGDTQFILNTHSPVLPEHLQRTDGALLVRCFRRGRVTRFAPFDDAELGTLLTPQAIEQALAEPTTSLRDRLVRGDLGS